MKVDGVPWAPAGPGSTTTRTNRSTNSERVVEIIYTPERRNEWREADDF
jgi:hypothetical protein